VWGAGVRGTLSAVGSAFEFRVISDGAVIRRQRYTSLRRALEAAKEWRVDYEVERAQRGTLAATHVQCPECGDEVSIEAQADDGSRLSCQECGHVWRLY
jgi:ribosomal protein S27AE